MKELKNKKCSLKMYFTDIKIYQNMPFLLEIHNCTVYKEKTAYIIKNNKWINLNAACIFIKI